MCGQGYTLETPYIFQSSAASTKGCVLYTSYTMSANTIKELN